MGQLHVRPARTDHDREELREGRCATLGAVQHVAAVEHPLPRRVVEPGQAGSGTGAAYPSHTVTMGSCERLQRVDGRGEGGAARMASDANARATDGDRPRRSQRRHAAPP